MTIIIPMAGLSSRFQNAGFVLPKYMLYIGEKSVFNMTVSSFSNYFKLANFIFVIRDVFDTKRFVENECLNLGINNYKVVTIDKLTRGQAETVYLGITKTSLESDEEIIIFNIDTICPNYEQPIFNTDYDGYLDVFRGSGKNWSYVEPNENNAQEVKRTAEKLEISDLCSTGLYHFKRADDFIKAFKGYNFIEKEFYIAPMYNYLIMNSRKILYNLINREQVIFSGNPDEYHELCAKFYCKK